jgi:predicted nucleic acid-binding protein
VTLAEHELLVPEVVAQEVRHVLEAKIGLPAGKVEAIDQLLRNQTLVVRPSSKTGVRVRHPDDAWVLASAVAGGAEVLVTGDQDLLTIEEPPLPILSPRSFWGRLRGSRGGGG